VIRQVARTARTNRIQKLNSAIPLSVRALHSSIR
jgi:hypothetical protein